MLLVPVPVPVLLLLLLLHPPHRTKPLNKLFDTPRPERARSRVRARTCTQTYSILLVDVDVSIWNPLAGVLLVFFWLAGASSRFCSTNCQLSFLPSHLKLWFNVHGVL